MKSELQKIGFVSLGCPKNLVDSEVMMGQLQQHGYQLTTDREEADVMVVNTCGFIQSAKEESINTIIEMAGLKDTAKLKRLVVAAVWSSVTARICSTSCRKWMPCWAPAKSKRSSRRLIRLPLPHKMPPSLRRMLG